MSLPSKIILGSVLFVLVSLVTIYVEFICLRDTTPPIETENGVAVLEKISIGNVDQSVLVRGHDKNNPIILFLHGGPGMPVMFLAHASQRSLEEDFTVVHWDRRGAGKSFKAAEDRSTLTVSQTLADTLELTNVLLNRFNKEKIYLAGHSWGSYLGLLAVAEKPEYYRAYVGMGQIAGTQNEVQRLRREFMVEAAERSADVELVERLQDPAYYGTEDDLFAHNGELYNATSFWPLLREGLFAPEYTIQDVANVKNGADLLSKEMRYDIEPKPLEGEISEFSVPIFFFLGKHDFNTPSKLANDYLERLKAPQKKVVWFEESAHFPFYEEPNLFHEKMNELHSGLSESTTN